MEIEPENIARAADALKGIANQTRLAILCHLSGKPMNVTELVEVTGASQSSVSQHLTKMVHSGWLSSERNGVSKTFRINHPSVEQLIDALYSMYCR